LLTGSETLLTDWTEMVHGTNWGLIMWGLTQEVLSQILSPALSQTTPVDYYHEKSFCLLAPGANSRFHVKKVRGFLELVFEDS